MADEDSFLSRWSRRKVQERRGDLLAEPPPPKPAAIVGASPGITSPVIASPVVASPGITSLGTGTAASVAGRPAPGAATRPQNDRLEPASGAADAAKPNDLAAAPLPTLADVAELTRDSDYSRFVVRGVDGEVKNAALKKLFTDPHFNLMDGLDTYIEDYGIPNPISPSMLRQMAQSHFLGLFDGEKDTDKQADLACSTADAQPADASAATPQTPPGPTLQPDCPIPHEHPDLRLQSNDVAGHLGADDRPGEDAGRKH